MPWSYLIALLDRMISRPSFDELSPQELSLLNQDTRRLRVLHKPTPGGSSFGTAIPGFFPVGVASAFSELIRSTIGRPEYGPESTTEQEVKSRIGRHDGEYVFINGATLDGVKTVLDFMLSWCEGIKSLPAFEFGTEFNRTFQALEAARLLKIPGPLLKVIDDQASELCNNHIPQACDVEVVYSCFPKDHQARQAVLAAFAVSTGAAADIHLLQQDFESLIPEIMEQFDDFNHYTDAQQLITRLEKQRESCMEIDLELWWLMNQSSIDLDED